MGEGESLNSFFVFWGGSGFFRARAIVTLIVFFIRFCLVFCFLCFFLLFRFFVLKICFVPTLTFQNKVGLAHNFNEIVGVTVLAALRWFFVAHFHDEATNFIAFFASKFVYWHLHFPLQLIKCLLISCVVFKRKVMLYIAVLSYLCQERLFYCLFSFLFCLGEKKIIFYQHRVKS